MAIQERILQLLEKKEVTPYKFCKDLSFSMGYLDKRGAIGTDKYLKIIKYFPEISPMWLLSGEGDMLKSELTEQKFSNNDKYTASLEKINALQEDKIANLEKTIKELKVNCKRLLLSKKMILSTCKEKTSVP